MLPINNNNLSANNIVKAERKLNEEEVVTADEINEVQKETVEQVASENVEFDGLELTALYNRALVDIRTPAQGSRKAAASNKSQNVGLNFRDNKPETENTTPGSTNVYNNDNNTAEGLFSWIGKAAKTIIAFCINPIGGAISLGIDLAVFLYNTFKK